MFLMINLAQPLSYLFYDVAYFIHNKGSLKRKSEIRFKQGVQFTVYKTKQLPAQSSNTLFLLKWSQ